MKRFVAAFLVLCLSIPAFAEDAWLGIFMQDKRVGYVFSSERDEEFEGKKAQRSDTTSVISLEMLGNTLYVSSKSSSWFDKNGRALRMVQEIESAGRSTKIDARFTASVVSLEYETGALGEDPGKGRRTLVLPKGVRVLDDPVGELTAGRLSAENKETPFVTLDANTFSLVRGTIKYAGLVEVEGKTGAKIQAHKIEVVDPRATTVAYVSGKGDLLYAEVPALGMQMRPETKEEATTNQSEGVDLALASAIKTDKPIEEAATRRTLGLRISGADLSHLPSNEHQTVVKDGDAWAVVIHPVRPSDVPRETIASASKNMERWTQPEPRMPSSDKKFVDLARKIVGGETVLLRAAEKLRKYVNSELRVNAGIGVLRDADEVLRSKEGVCRDHAILLATLMRAAGIPARLATGIVYSDGYFYYHAWTEVWSGAKWVGMDSTRPSEFLDATHVQVGLGSVADAMTSFLLPGARIEVAGEPVS